MKSKNIFLLFLFFIPSNFLFAQYSALDSTYSNDGIDTIYCGNPKGIEVLYEIALQSDNKTVMFGGCSPYTITQGGVLIMRYNTDGTLDQSFATGGIDTPNLNMALPNQYGLWCMNGAIQSDGKILFAGFSSSIINNDKNVFIVRLNQNGSIDNSFGNNGAVFYNFGQVDGTQTERVIVQANGKILLLCSSDNSSTPNNSYLIRYLPNGNIDNAFGINGKKILDPFFGNHVQELPNGKIILAGNVSKSTLMQLTSNGQTDSTFGVNGIAQTNFANFYDRANHFQLLPTGEIIIVGDEGTSFAPGEFFLAKFKSNGVVDSSYGINGVASYYFGGYFTTGSCSALDNNKMIVIGTYSPTKYSQKYFICRINSNGFIDSTFAKNGIDTTAIGVIYLGTLSQANSCVLNSNGQLTVCGFSQSGNGLYTNDLVSSARYSMRKLIGLSEIKFGNQIKSYPNPTNNSTNITVSKPLNNASVKLINLTGQIIFEKQNQSCNQFSIDLTNQPQGIYFLEIHEAENIWRSKIVKQ
jgi:uncharacterized delta-60 repeat protein